MTKTCLIYGRVRTSEYTKEKDNFKITAYNSRPHIIEPESLRARVTKFVKDWQYRGNIHMRNIGMKHMQTLIDELLPFIEQEKKRP